MSQLNKTYINLLCILILGLLAVKVIVPLCSIGSSFTDSVSNHELTDTHTPFVSQFSANPKVSFAPTDTLTFESGERYPVIIKEVNLFVPDSRIPGWVNLTTGLCYLFAALVVLIGFYQFIRFIVNINRSRIFVRDNVKRLNNFGWLLLISAALMIIAGYSESTMVNSINGIYSGRTLQAVWDFPWSSLLIGLTSLLMSRIWYRGIQLREDNDLTI